MSKVLVDDENSLNDSSEILHERESSGRKVRGRLVSKDHSNEGDRRLHQEAFNLEKRYC